MKSLLAVILGCLCLGFTFTSGGGTGNPAGPSFGCASATVNGATTGTLACVATGDWIIALSCGNLGSATQTVTCPAGFSAPTNSLSGPTADGNTQGQKVCYKIATAGDTSASTYTFTYNGTGSGFNTTAALDFKGGSQQFDVSAVQSGTTGASWSSPAVTTTRVNNMVVVSWCTTGGHTWTSNPPSGWNLGYDSGGSTTSVMTASYAAVAKVSTITAPFISASGGGSSNSENTIAFGGF